METWERMVQEVHPPPPIGTCLEPNPRNVQHVAEGHTMMIATIAYKFGLPQSTFLPKNIGLGTLGRIELGHSE